MNKRDQAHLEVALAEIIGLMEDIELWVMERRKARQKEE